jgi:geranylgeranyl diphosphate synthase type II
VTATPIVTEYIARYRDLVATEIDKYIPDGEPGKYLYDLVSHSVLREGKALRSSICLAAATAFGADPEAAVGLAVAIELVHQAFLVHDDIQDGSERRRGQPALHAQYGVPLAINAGDALAVLSFQPLFKAQSRLGSSLTARILKEFHHTILSTIEGQSMDLGWRHDNLCELSLADYLGMVLRKTCCYTTIHPLRVGALVGSWGRADLADITRFGFHLGAAFQIQDDVLDLTAGDAYGKDCLGDLYEGKRSLPLVHLLSACRDAEHDEVVHFLGLDRNSRSPEAVARMHALLVHHGSIDFSRQFAQGIANAATEAFESVLAILPPSDDLRFLAALPGFVVERAA